MTRIWQSDGMSFLRVDYKKILASVLLILSCSFYLLIPMKEGEAYMARN